MQECYDRKPQRSTHEKRSAVIGVKRGVVRMYTVTSPLVRAFRRLADRYVFASYPPLWHRRGMCFTLPDSDIPYCTSVDSWRPSWLVVERISSWLTDWLTDSTTIRSTGSSRGKGRTYGQQQHIRCVDILTKVPLIFSVLTRVDVWVVVTNVLKKSLQFPTMCICNCFRIPLLNELQQQILI